MLIIAAAFWPTWPDSVILDPPPARVSTRGNWWALHETYELNKSYARAERDRPPVACPNDGQVLEYGPRGELHCPFDGWIWTGTSTGWR